MTEATPPQPAPIPEDLQQMLATAVTLGQGITTLVYEERKRRLVRNEPPESYFKTETALGDAFEGNAKIDFPQREGFEYAELMTAPAHRWPEDSELTVRHHIKLGEEAVEELLASYYIQRIGDASLLLTTTTEDITQRNIWMRARDDIGPRFHDDYAVHLEINNAHMARHNSAVYAARKEEQELGLHDAGTSEARDLLALLTEGMVRMPTGQNPY